jgi:hypothetical protein
MSSKDLQPILKNWTFEPNRIAVRKIIGEDGQPKIQMRLPLGVLQMETSGRPDGERPHHCESLLEFHEKQLINYEQRNGTRLGYTMAPDQVQAVRDEALMYYQRYLAAFVLEDFADVVRDTERNLRVLDLCRDYAEEESDREAFEGYRPYIVMMNARSRAQVADSAGQIAKAIEEIDGGLNTIRDFFYAFDRPEGFEHSDEAKILREMRKKMSAKLPVSDVDLLLNQLNEAIEEERFEDAASLRDRIQQKKS